MLSGDNGILQRATDAKTKSDEAQIRERIQLAYHSALTKDLTGESNELTEDTLSEELENEFKDKTFTIIPTEDKKQWVIKVDNVEVSVIAGQKEKVETTYIAYNIGDKVTIGNETFFVIENSDETKSTVKLITKENIDLSNLVQSTSASEVVFSTANYWIDANSDGGKCRYGNYPADLTSDTNILTTDGKTALYGAQEYGKKLGAENGTLLTLSEAQGFREVESILFANNGEYKSENNYLNFWIRTVASSTNVLVVKGEISNIIPCDYNSGYGVRPVIEILKSKI